MLWVEVALGCFSFWSHGLVGCDPLHSTGISHIEQIAHLCWGVGRSPTLQSRGFIFCRWPGTEESSATFSCSVFASVCFMMLQTTFSPCSAHKPFEGLFILLTSLHKTPISETERKLCHFHAIFSLKKPWGKCHGPSNKQKLLKSRDWEKRTTLKSIVKWWRPRRWWCHSHQGTK